MCISSIADFPKLVKGDVQVGNRNCCKVWNHQNNLSPHSTAGYLPAEEGHQLDTNTLQWSSPFLKYKGTQYLYNQTPYLFFYTMLFSPNADWAFLMRIAKSGKSLLQLWPFQQGAGGIAHLQGDFTEQQKLLRQGNLHLTAVDQDVCHSGTLHAGCRDRGVHKELVLFIRQIRRH